MQVNKDIIARVGTEGVDSANADLNNFGSTLMGLGKKATVLGMALVAVQKSFKFFTDSISTAKEFEMLKNFDYLVINSDKHLDQTIADIQAIIRAEHLKTCPRSVDL